VRRPRRLCKLGGLQRQRPSVLTREWRHILKVNHKARRFSEALERAKRWTLAAALASGNGWLRRIGRFCQLLSGLAADGTECAHTVHAQ